MTAPVKKPLPVPNPDTLPFWGACRRHELRFQHCRPCGHVRWPAARFCPQCHSDQADWVLSSGSGRVHAFVIHHHAIHPAFAGEVPYITAVIALTDGPFFLSNIVGCDPQAVHIDMPVALVWEDVDAQFSLPKFTPQA